MYEDYNVRPNHVSFFKVKNKSHDGVQIACLFFSSVQSQILTLDQLFWITVQLWLLLIISSQGSYYLSLARIIPAGDTGTLYTIPAADALFTIPSTYLSKKPSAYKPIWSDLFFSPCYWIFVLHRFMSYYHHYLHPISCWVTLASCLIIQFYSCILSWTIFSLVRSASGQADYF